MKAVIEAAISLRGLAPAWKELRRSLPFFGPIRNGRDYARMNALMERLLAEVGDDESHPYADLLDVVATLVGHYEDAHQPAIPSAAAHEVLRHLMDEHGLRQSDLREEIGSQGVVSEVLAGKRALKARHAKALSKRFGVSPSVFL